MLANERLDPRHIRDAEATAAREWGDDWSKPKPLGQAFADLIEVEPVVALSRKSYLLQAAPQQEDNIAEALRDAGLDVYVPHEPKSVRTGHIKRKTVMKPMMPGYVFPIFDVYRDHWQVIPTIAGVLRLFMVHFRPLPIPDEAVQRMRDQEIEAEMRGKRRSKAPIAFKIGDWVQIDDRGAWHGHIGQVAELLVHKQRIKAEIDVFGRKVPVAVSVNHVRPM